MQNDPILTVDRIFQDDEFKAKSLEPVCWLDDEGGYTRLEGAPEDEKVKEIVRYDVLSGERRVVVTAADLTPPGAGKPLVVKEYAWSEDGSRVLLFTNTQKVWRVETRGDYWVLDVASKRLRQLGGDRPAASLMFARFAPDGVPNGGSVAYVYAHNIYVEDVESGEITQLTADGSDTIINGTSDWVYEEEFHLRDGFCWSPDGRTIAYWQFDTTGIESFYLINNTDNLYPQLTAIPYPKAGTTNPACRVGIVPAAGGETTWLAVPGDPRQHYIPKMEWAAGSEEVLIQQLNRLQNENRLFLGKASDGSVRLIHTERDEAWLEVRTDDVKWLAEGQAFTWISEQHGWRQLYRLSRDGQQMTLLTPGSYDVLSVQQVDEATNSVYFMASPEQTSQRYLYRASLDGGGKAERVSPPPNPHQGGGVGSGGGSHSYYFSPQARYAFHTYATINRPPVTSLISLPDHQSLRVLEDNEALREKVAALAGPPAEFFRIEIEEGVWLDGWCLKPPDFDPSQRYPLLGYVYGEPSGLTVLDNWGSKHYLWHRLLAQRGYLVISVDNRGTPGPKGRAWRKGVYRQVGVMTTADQAAAVQALIRERPYIDPERVGVWGWSGGGTMTLNLLFQYPGLYKTGIAVAPVSDLRLYDTIYQERYMGLPEENEAGYREGSPITYAHQLEGNLLLIHGTGDDNVHYQATERLVNELIKHNKVFTMMAYPNRSHSISEGDNTSRHLYRLMTRFLEANL